MKHFKTLWNNKWLIIISIILVSIWSYFYSKNIKPVYSNTAFLYVSYQKVKLSSNSTEITPLPLRASGVIRTLAMRNGDYNFAEQIVKKLGWKKSSPEIRDISNNLSVFFKPGTMLLAIKARSDNPDDAVLIANTAQAIFIETVDILSEKLKIMPEAKLFKAIPASSSNNPFLEKPRPIRAMAYAAVTTLLISSFLVLIINQKIKKDSE
jgi:capsular polysaccharide biosynthesis protein